MRHIRHVRHKNRRRIADGASDVMYDVMYDVTYDVIYDVTYDVMYHVTAQEQETHRGWCKCYWRSAA